MQASGIIEAVDGVGDGGMRGSICLIRAGDFLAREHSGRYSGTDAISPASSSSCDRTSNQLIQAGEGKASASPGVFPPLLLAPESQNQVEAIEFV
jgi:hypothetical protein